MSLLAAILGCFMSGSLLVCPNPPLDYGMVGQVKEQPYLEGKATWYDYQLNGNWWSKTHDTCALRVLPKYGHYKVCLKDTDKCVICRQNDYGPAEYTNKVIDLSSHAFKQLAPLSKGVIEVDIYKVN